MEWDIKNASNIPKQGCLKTLLGQGRYTNYKKMLERADKSVASELDLIKFIRR